MQQKTGLASDQSSPKVYVGYCESRDPWIDEGSFGTKV